MKTKTQDLRGVPRKEARVKTLEFLRENLGEAGLQEAIDWGALAVKKVRMRSGSKFCTTKAMRICMVTNTFCGVAGFAAHILAWEQVKRSLTITDADEQMLMAVPQSTKLN